MTKRVELKADSASCTMQEFTLDPGVSSATNGSASEDQLLQTEEHRAGDQGAGHRGYNKKSLNYIIKKENLTLIIQFLKFNSLLRYLILFCYMLLVVESMSQSASKSVIIIIIIKDVKGFLFLSL